MTDLPYPLFTLNHQPEKTNPTYYKMMLQHFNLTPAKVIYFEHNKEAVASAKSVGITTYYYDSEMKDTEALKVFLDTNL
jgi:FMN phosphatase YigB (HAD superfamily)